MRYERLKISKPIVKAVLASEKHVFWASQTCFMLQSTAKSSAMVPRMIWDHVVLGQKMTKNRDFWPKPWETLQNSSKLGVLGSKTLKNTQKHSKTLKNTQKHSKTLKNTQKHNVHGHPGTGITTNSNFCQKN